MKNDINIIKEEITNFLNFLKSNENFEKIRKHLKLEHWIAAEAYGFFQHKQEGWESSPGELPYSSQGRDKWCDFYLRLVTHDKELHHIFFEFKAIPIDATSASKTLRGFLKDVDALLKFERVKTIKYWKDEKSPNNGSKQSSWFKKFHGIKDDIEKGEFHGIAIIFIEVNNEEKIEPSKIKKLIEKFKNDINVPEMSIEIGNNDNVMFLSYYIRVKN